MIRVSEEDMEEIFEMSDKSSNLQVRKFRNFYKTLKAWDANVEVWKHNDDGFVAFTNGKTVNYLYDIVVREDRKRQGIGKILLDKYLESSKGKKIHFRADERFDGYVFFDKMGFSPQKRKDTECIYECWLE